MANVTYQNVLDAAATLIAGAHEELTSRVYKRERFSESEEEFVSLLSSLNESDNSPSGAIIQWIGWDSKRDGTFSIIQIERFAIEILLEYNDARSDGKTSTDVFREVLAAIRQVFNKRANVDLALGSTVQSRLLQASNSDFVVRRFGEDEGSRVVHFASLSLDVEVIIDACQE